jgi:hypothetical protein
LSTTRQRRGFAGVNKLRKTLRRLDPEITKDIKVVLSRGAKAIHRDAVNNAETANYGQIPGIRDTGDLIRSIGIKYSRDELSVLIGPGAGDATLKNLGPQAAKLTKTGKQTKASIRNREAQWNAMKGYWAEFGTKGDPSRNIPAITPTPFMNPAFDSNKAWLRSEVKDAVSKVLASVSAGTSDE